MTKTPYYKDIPASKLVNILGKYLFKNIDGAYRFRISPNMYDIYTVVLYQYTYKGARPGDPDVESDVFEMHIDINLTTYQNKIRMNLIEMSPDERTLGFYVIVPEKIEGPEFMERWVMKNITKTLNKWFEGYTFLW